MQSPHSSRPATAPAAPPQWQSDVIRRNAPPRKPSSALESLEAKYNGVKSLWAAAKAGHVKLLSARWVLDRAGCVREGP